MARFSIRLYKSIEILLLNEIIQKCGEHSIFLDVHVPSSYDSLYESVCTKFLNNIQVNFTKLQALNICETCENAPALKHFPQPNLLEFGCSLAYNSDLQSTKNFIRLNPQLTSLRIQCLNAVAEAPLDLIKSLNLNKNLPLLKILRLQVINFGDIDVDREKKIEMFGRSGFRNLNEFCVESYDYHLENILSLFGFDNITKQNLIIHRKNRVRSDNIPILSDSILQSIYQFNNLRHLCIDGYACMSDLRRMAKNLTLLKTFRVSYRLLAIYRPKPTLEEFSEFFSPIP